MNTQIQTRSPLRHTMFPRLVVAANALMFGACGVGSPSNPASIDAGTDAANATGPGDAGSLDATGLQDAGASDTSTAAPPGSIQCVDGGLTFTLNVVTTGAFCLGSNDCGDWLSIRDPGGAPLTVNAPPGAGVCIFTCDQCSSAGPCGSLGCGPTSYPLTSQVAPRAWSGAYFISDSCGAHSTACFDAKCAVPGQYVATMCAHQPSGQDMTSAASCEITDAAQPVCTDTVFVWPPSGSDAHVIGTIILDGGTG